MNADTIVVVDQGQILEQGSHDDLIVRGGKYASLWAKQVFLKPKDNTKNPDPSASGAVVNDLTSAENEIELAKVVSSDTKEHEEHKPSKLDKSEDS
jgi:hypothetical protein